MEKKFGETLSRVSTLEAEKTTLETDNEVHELKWLANTSRVYLEMIVQNLFDCVMRLATVWEATL